MDWLSLIIGFLAKLAKYEPEAEAFLNVIRDLAHANQLPGGMNQRVRDLHPDPLPTAQAIEELRARGGA